IFTIPEVRIPKVGARIMSLQDPTKKMSKSDTNKKGFISMIDTPKHNEKKIKSAITDSEGIVKFDKENKPGVSNLLTIHSIFSNESIEDLELRYADEGYGQFKQGVANAVLQVIEPIQEKYNALLDSEELDDILDARQQKDEALTNKNV